MNQNHPTKNKLRVAAVGDLHVHEVSQGLFKEMFAEISEKADVLLICGDFTNLGLLSEAENLAKDLSACTIPILAVLGNHDHQSGQVEEIKKILSGSNVTFLEDETYTINGVGFAGVKGFGGGFDSHIVGSFGEAATKAFVSEGVNEALRLENALHQLQTEKKVVALHYSPISATVQGEAPEIFAFLGCSRLAETIDRFDVSVVFHGHSHNGQSFGKTLKGIPVYNCAIDVLRKQDPTQNFCIVEV